MTEHAEVRTVAIRDNGNAMPIPQQSETAAVLSMIERAARDPSVDIDKLERLMEMSERIAARNSKGAYAAALSAMQPELPAVVERGKIKVGNEVRSTYALWEDVNQTIQPILARHGFALSFRVQTADKITVTGVLSHRDGHSEETTITLPIDASGSKNAVQAIGSSVSYGKRYTAGALLNLTSRGEDDDAKAAGAGQPISDEQVEHLKTLLAEADADIAKFCAFMEVDGLAQITARDYDKATKALQQAIRRARK